ncbi:MAG: hypothetical protein ACREJ5_04375 [Geminicoccaceae bacterium]
MATLRVITPPAAPISILAARDHLRADAEELPSAELSDMIQAAFSRLDGPDGVLGRALEPQVLEYRIDRFADPICLPLPPLVSVDLIKYIDPDGVEQTLASFRVFGVGGDGRIEPVFGSSFPATRPLPEAVQITFTAGEVTPTPVQRAILMHLAWLDQVRAGTADGRFRPDDLPAGYAELIAPYRATFIF